MLCPSLRFLMVGLSVVLCFIEHFSGSGGSETHFGTIFISFDRSSWGEIRFSLHPGKLMSCKSRKLRGFI